MPDGSSRPRLAFVGLGWIGRHRMQALADENIADIVAIGDADSEACARARGVAPQAAVRYALEDVLDLEPDGVVLATPSAMHATQSIRALEAGAAVFCQKPLGRHAREVWDVIDAARRANRLLGVDVSYRFTEGLRVLHEIVRRGELGDVYAIDLTFHNAFGPDKPWFYDVEQSGGGCLLDLGVHLVDFLHWTFDVPVARVAGHVYAQGRRVQPREPRVEDYAIGEIELATGTVARLACSWKLAAGCDAQIAITIHGTLGGCGFRNVNGSFYDFTAERYRGTQTDVLCRPPDAWGGRALVSWARALSRSNVFDPDIAVAGRVATTIDALYGRRPSDRDELRAPVDRQHATELRP